METKILLCIIIFLGAAIVCLFIYGKRREDKLLDRLEKQITDAIDGNFAEGVPKESKASELESELWRFLSDSQCSADNLQAQKDRIQSLISDISHQTLTPVSNIKIYAELLEEQQIMWKEMYGVVDKDMETEIAAIRSQIDKLEFLIESLVKMSRMENGVIVLNPQINLIQEVLDATRKQFFTKAEKKELKLLVEDSNEEADFDLKWTVEAIANIVDNAIKYTDAGGTISIKIQPLTLFLCVEISDTGIGIAESELAKVFSRFYRSAAVKNEPGVGVGLYLAREIIEMEKGYIKVTSTLGKGTSFFVYLHRQE